MKAFKTLSIIIVLAMLFVAVIPASAQLGQTDISSFTVQNVDSETATVTIHFYSDTGAVYTPSFLDKDHPEETNPFNLVPGQSYEVYLPAIPDDQLPDGRYSVVIESSARVVTIANLIGQGSIYFNGSYSGFDSGANIFYVPAVGYNYYGWYSLISVQNVGGGLADITVTITCNDGTVGTLSKMDVPVNTAAHFDLETTLPVGFSTTTKCNGSAMVEADQPIVAVDNASVPTLGNTQSYSGVANGFAKVFVPALYHKYYGWDSSINIRKLGSGNTTVTVDYDDDDPNSTCALTDAIPSCLLYMPVAHPTNGSVIRADGQFGATITNSANLELVVVVNAANGSQAQSYNGIGNGSSSVGIPSTMKYYYGWMTSVTCQNIGSIPTSLDVVYDRYTTVVESPELAPGESWERWTPIESFLPNGYQGGATVTANAVGGLINCIVNFNNPNMMSTSVGDWSMSNNAFPK
jgi:hypothetical protein